MSGQTPTPTPPLKGRGLSSRETSARANSPPLQGRGRGWGLSSARLIELSDHARTMRRNPTEPEIRLWRVLSRSQLGGYKFRRQAVIGAAIADFLCPQKGLVVEVDGNTHADPAADARRTARLEALGYRVVRYTNDDVMRNIDGVRRHLLDVLDSLPDRRPPHPNPSPEEEGLER
jgi:very-short-patch-repair endonuclease